jgi:hypothetical protein
MLYNSTASLYDIFLICITSDYKNNNIIQKKSVFMKKLVLHCINLPLLLGALSASSYALEAMDDDELSSTTGEGIGVIVDNLSIHSGDKGDLDGFEITLDLSETAGLNQFIFSELRLHKSGTVSGSADSGGSFGTVANPVYMGDLRAADVFTGDVSDTVASDSNYTASTVIRSEFPGAGIEQLDRSTDYQESNPGDVDTVGSYAYYNAAFQSSLDSVSDKFNFHFRFDDVVNGGAESFRAIIDIEEFRFYGTYSDIFATDSNGFSMAGATGVYIDSLTISAEESTSASIAAAAISGSYAQTPVDSQITLNGIDIYTVLGTVDQPLTITSVVDEYGNNQLQLEIGALPASVGDVPKSDIYIESIFFGEQYNPDLRTSFLGGDASADENYTYAFQPEVGNTIEIIGMTIQHLKITTMDI